MNLLGDFTLSCEKYQQSLKAAKCLQHLIYTKCWMHSLSESLVKLTVRRILATPTSM